MSDLTASPQSGPVSPGNPGPQRVEGSNPARDDKTPESRPQGEPHSPGARPHSQSEARAHDPAVAVSPSLARLAPGVTVSGEVVRIDGEGRPILKTDDGIFALKPNPGVATGNRVTIEITSVGRTAEGRVINRDGQPVEPPVPVSLTLTNLTKAPETLPDGTPDPAKSSAPIATYNAPFAARPVQESSEEVLPVPAAAVGTAAAQKAKTAVETATAHPNLATLNAILGAQDVGVADAKGAASRAPSESTTETLAPRELPSALFERPLSARVALAAENLANKLKISLEAGAIVRIRLLSGEKSSIPAGFGVRTEGRIIDAAAVVGLAARRTGQLPESFGPSSPYPQSGQHHYLETPVGVFVFRFDGLIESGTPLTAVIAPETSQNQIGGDATAASGAQPASADSAPVTTGAILPPDTATSTSPWPRWDVLQEILASLKAMDPALAAATAMRFPAPGERLANGLLFTLAAVTHGEPRAFIGDAAARALEDAGRQDLIARLGREMAAAARLGTSDVRPGEWRLLPMPFQPDQGSQPLNLLWQTPVDPDRSGEGQDWRDSSGDDHAPHRRFVIEFAMGTLGTLQLDGLIDGHRFELYFRSEHPLSPHSRDEIEGLFARALERGNLVGSIRFSELADASVRASDIRKQIESNAGHSPLMA